MEQDPFVSPGRRDFCLLRRDGKRPAIPQFVVGTDRAHHAGQRGFHRKGNKNLAGFPLSWMTRCFGLNCEFPQSFQVQPLVANKLWPRIFGMHIFRSNLRRPFRHQRCFFGLPFGTVCRAFRKQKEDCKNKDAIHLRALST